MNSLPAKVRLQKIWVPACMPKCMTDQQDEPMHFKCRSKISVLKFSNSYLRALSFYALINRNGLEGNTRF